MLSIPIEEKDEISYVFAALDDLGRTLQGKSGICTVGHPGMMGAFRFSDLPRIAV